MEQIGPTGFTGETQDGNLFAAEAWTEAFETMDIAAHYAGAFEIAEIDPLDIEDDLITLVARRPSRRLRLRH